MVPGPSSPELAELVDAERAERRRLADALHDGPLQALLAARQDAEEALAGDQDLLATLPDRLQEVADALRSLLTSMHEDGLDADPLDVAIGRIADEAARRGRFTTTVTVTPAAHGIHDALVREAARELLGNVVRHARATAAVVDVTVAAGRLDVRVVDDGLGVDDRRVRGAGAAGHVGLERLRRGADALGGTLTVQRGASTGTVARVGWSVEALVAQRRLEEQLREDRRWTAAVASTVQDGLLVLRDGAIVQVNDALERLVGHDRGALLGARAPWPFWPPQDAAALDALLEQTRREGGAGGAHELRHGDGSAIPVLVAAARVPDGAQGRGGVLVTFKDLRERRREEERLRLEAELRTTVGTTRRLTGILAAVPHGPAAIYAALRETLGQHLGWQDLVVNRRRDDGRWEVAWTSGPELDVALLGAVYADADWAPLMMPRFARAGTFFVPAEAEVSIDGPDHVPELGGPVAAGADAWRPHDLLLVPMRDADGHPAGILSVDRPASGLRPTDTELEVLAVVAAHAAQALALAGAGSGAA
ncbi:PAS domain S-box protein [Conexibacter sp. W3-3-2]|uniref:PAS domain S-box protein n=1 Tax=Conexibacter sp. W3-3-2 TaxID=2675227 RepID=UPI0012B764B3|nr:PAS domain S-box protein [Conexibacter sp. W3-3-2]MTD45424.1 PAS domain S-box protein [Conexibacter sp. W3-3-2]